MGNYAIRYVEEDEMEDEEEDLVDEEEKSEEEDNKVDYNAQLEEFEVDYHDICPQDYKEELRRMGMCLSLIDEEKGICVGMGGWKYPNPGKRLNDLLIISGLNDQHISYKSITQIDEYQPAPRNLHKSVCVKMEDKYRFYIFR